MSEGSIVRDQRVKAAKVDRSRELRREMTGAERRLWERLRNNSFGVRFRRQQVIDGFIADFYAPTVKLVIEVDGPIHEQQIEYDQERDQIIAAHNLQIIRVTNQQILDNLEEIVHEIAAICTVKTAHPERNNQR